ncbi:MAG: QueT transporter family protein [Eubacterium sp.]|nr:QueT transporter family protein [Eubacterium sp.]
MKIQTKDLVISAMIAAIYVVLTIVFSPISFGEVQVRIAEALTILPVFTPCAIPGLFIGCLLGNILGGAVLPDILFGSLATLLGACGTYLLRSRAKIFWPLPPILANTIIVPLVLRFAYGILLPVPLLMIYIAIGEIISCGALGLGLHALLKSHASALFFPKNKKQN